MTDAYIYQAAMLCEDCGAETRLKLKKAGKAPEDTDDEDTYDSDEYPKGPYPDGGGESDAPEHCDQCGVFLENDLTEAGHEYVKDLIAQHFRSGRGDKKVLKEWADFYDIPFEKSDEEPAENPRKNGKRGPGKFDSDLDAALYELTLDGGADEEVGDAQDFGWYGLLDADGESLIDDLRGMGAELDEDDYQFLKKQAGVILFENSQGFVEGTYFQKEEDLKKAWEELQQEAEEFYGEGE